MIPLYFQLVGIFKHVERSYRRPGHRSEPSLEWVHIYENKKVEFNMACSCRNMFSNYLHFIGKDWIATHYFEDEIRFFEDESGVRHSTTRSYSPLRIRGNRVNAEQHIMLACLKWL